MASLHEIYIENHLIPDILAQLKDEELISYTAEHSTGLDGFMSNLYNIQLKTKSEKGDKHRLLIAKFMRGDVAFRESSKSYIQFANEIHIYSNVLPEYEKLLKDLKVNTVKITDLVPRSYAAKFGYIEGNFLKKKYVCFIHKKFLRFEFFCYGKRSNFSFGKS